MNEPGDNPESTARLLELVRAGDARARDRLVARYQPALRRFAHGRLPAQARDLLDTDDLVQVTVIRALNHLDSFEPRSEGAFLAYLRQILMNQVRDEARRVARTPERVAMPERVEDAGRSPLEDVIGHEAVERYEAALARLSPEHREAIVLRLELGLTYGEIAEALERPTHDAARMLVTRALIKLAEEMKDLRERTR